MRIVIDLTVSEKKAGSGPVLFFNDLVKDVIIQAQHHEIICLVSGHDALPASFPAGITAYPVGKSVNTLVGQAWWYRFGLPAMLKKAGADLYITADKADFADPAIHTCLFLIATNLADKAVSSAFRKALQAAALVISVSDANHARLQQILAPAGEKIKRLAVRIKEPGIPLTWDEKEQVKSEYASGREFFLFMADPTVEYDTMALLKAFSAFKKWQHSNMQLVITGAARWMPGMMKLLQHYKYRDDVHLYTDPSATACTAMMDAAYAFVYPAITDQFPYRILQAVRAGTPVISFSTPFISAVAGTSVLYADASDFNDLSRNMQFLYKDEALRSRMIDDARTLLAGSTGNDQAEQVAEFLNLSAP